MFDKSFLQSLSVDETVIIGQMFSCGITPLFFVETMAELTKGTAGRAGRWRSRREDPGRP